MAYCNSKKALKRLIRDQQELVESPLPNIAASPLESNMMEWHCNLRHHGEIYHVILYLPRDYPFAAPKVEIVPSGFQMGHISVSHSPRGTKLCLDLFSNSEDMHPEWKLQSDSGWSPSYTIQGLLLNLLSYFDDNFKVEDDSLVHYQKKCATFACPDCGHCLAKPYPPLCEDEDIGTDMPLSDQERPIIHEDGMSSVEKRQTYLEGLEGRITDYISRDKFSVANTSSTSLVFGYGLMFPTYDEKCYPTTPCEFVTADSFYGMCKNLGYARSMLREKISHFLPLYITGEHARKIKHHFEKTMAMITKKRRFRKRFFFTSNYTDTTINVLAHLLSSIVNGCFWKSCITVDSLFNGYFQLHRLFLWAADEYPKVQKDIEKRIQSAIFESHANTETSGADFDNCCVLLSVSKIYDWKGVHEIYLREHWRRSLQLCLEKDPEMFSQDTTDDVKVYKLRQAFDLDCQRLAFQVAFLQMAKPHGMSKHDVLQRYSTNLSFPSQEMVSELRKTLTKIITDVKSFDDWFNTIGFHTPLREELFNEFKDRIVKPGLQFL